MFDFYFPAGVISSKATFEVIAWCTKVISATCFTLSETNYRLIIANLVFVIFRFLVAALTALLLTLLAADIALEEFWF